jgi:serine/threonine-protein kinase
MGAVYLAEHTAAHFDHRVALKVVRKALGGKAAIERFERERHILAGLQHPGIALLFDGGQTLEGQPFYTMEYVDGEPITDYCDAHQLAVIDRVRLLLQVASTLAYAHQNLIVHRDIKSSNVLVTPEGHVKLVDFGLAKLLSEETLPSMTQTGLGPMTPAYAAPEQFHNGAVTVATDIYQFGILSFLVLTGRLPYRADPHDSLAWALAVTEKEEPLSLRRAHLLAHSEESSGTGTRRSNRHLTQDLDAIVRKCLSKAREKRYRSVDAMIADFENYLTGRPVQARRASMWYFVWRFVTRRRNVAIGLVAAAIVLTVDFSVYFRTAGERQRRLARETDMRDVTRTMMIDLLHTADGDGNRPRSSLDSLERDTARAMQKFGSSPRLRAIATSILAADYLESGHALRALRLTNEAMDALASDRSGSIEDALPLELLSARAALALGDGARAGQSLAQADRHIEALRLPSWAPERLAVNTARLQIRAQEDPAGAALAMAELIRESDRAELRTTLEFATLLSAYGATSFDDTSALDAFRRALPIYEQHCGEDCPAKLRTERLMLLRDGMSAGTLDSDAVAAEQERRVSVLFGSESPDYAAALIAHGRIRLLHGDAGGASENCARASELIASEDDIAPELRADVAGLCVEAAVVLGHPDDAYVLGSAALATPASGSSSDATNLRIEVALARCLAGDVVHAFELGEPALRAMTRQLPLQHRITARNAERLAGCFSAAGEPAHADRFRAALLAIPERR